MSYLFAFLLGVLQVSLVAANSRQINALRWKGAFLGGVGISAVWTMNVKSVALGGYGVAFCYSFGAGCGTVLGMWLTRKLKRDGV